MPDGVEAEPSIARGGTVPKLKSNETMHELMEGDGADESQDLDPVIPKIVYHACIKHPNKSLINETKSSNLQ